MERKPSNRNHNTPGNNPTPPPSGGMRLVQNESTVTPPAQSAQQNKSRVVEPAHEVKVGMKAVHACLVKRKDAINQVLPKGCDTDANTLITNALSYMMADENRNLRVCTPVSVLSCVMAAAKLGLDFIGDLAYMVPRKKMDRDGNILYWYASFMPGYQGFITVAARNGYHINAQVVYDHDQFEVDLGQRLVVHKPELRGERGQVIGAYAAAHRERDMAITFIDWMNKAHLDNIKGDSDAWKFHYDEMCRSRPVRRLYKYLAKVNGTMALAHEMANRCDSDQSIDDLLGIDQVLGED